MINNFWEEQHMSLDIVNFHEKEVQKFGVPEWLKLKCPYCSHDLSLHGIRTIGLKLNTRNMGDLVVEFVCDSCSRGNTFYYRQEVKNIMEFCDKLSGLKQVETKPVVEEDMYKMRYNNVLEKMVMADFKSQEKAQGV